MKCLCNKNVPCIPQGNDFKIAIVLKEYIREDGITKEREVGIGGITSVSVIKSNGDAVTQNVYSYTIIGSTIILNFANQESENGLPKGSYGVEVKGTRNDTDESNFRFFLPPPYAFNIVNSTIDGRFPSDSIITYTVDGVVGVALNVSSGGGGGATGTLNTNNSTALTPSSSESFGGNINLNRVAKTGNYNDLNNKPTIPAEQIQSDWNQTNTNAKDFIKNKPSVPTKTSDLTNNSGFLTQHQDISGKEDKITIATALAANSTAEFGKYYRLYLSTATTINLPAVTGSETTLKGFLIYLTVNTGGSVDWNANNNEPIVESGLSSIAEGKTYEVNAAWNGVVWAITANEFTSYSTT